MTGKSHQIIGLSIGLAMAWPITGLDSLLIIGAASLASRLPDIDLQIRCVSHRGVTHSLLTVSILLALAIQIGHPAALAFVASYAAHIVADMLTISGVRLLWPVDRSVHLVPRPARIRTGGVIEDVLITVIAVAVLLWILQASGWDGSLPIM